MASSTSRRVGVSARRAQAGMIAASTLCATDPLATYGAIAVNVVSLNQPKRAHQRVRRGETLLDIGDSFFRLYVVRVGFLKCLTLSDGGLMQVTGFMMTDDVIGLDGIDTGQYQSQVVALEESELFILPFAECQQWSRKSAPGQLLMMRALAREIARQQEHMILLGSMPADQRVATFLLEFSERFGRLGYSRSQFLLRMTRQEIGSYLGLKLETVSRMLSRFQHEGLIQIQGRSIVLLDFPTLWWLSGRSPNYPRPRPEAILDRKGDLLPSVSLGTIAGH